MLKRAKLWINGEDYVWIYLIDGGASLELGKAWDAPMKRDDQVHHHMAEHGQGLTLTLKVDEVEEL